MSDPINPLADPTKVEQAQKIVKDYLLWTGAVGIIPVPFVDSAAVAAFQIKMIQKIGNVYGQDLSTHWIKSTIGSLLGGFTAMSIGKGFGRQLVRSIPIVGGLASVVLAPGMAAGATYALGQIFIMHFESGGTLLTFDASAYAAKAKEMASNGVPATVAASPADGSGDTAKTAKAK